MRTLILSKLLPFLYAFEGESMQADKELLPEVMVFAEPNAFLYWENDFWDESGIKQLTGT